MNGIQSMFDIAHFHQMSIYIFLIMNNNRKMMGLLAISLELVPMFVL
jgi:hypothetical protein